MHAYQIFKNGKPFDRKIVLTDVEDLVKKDLTSDNQSVEKICLNAYKIVGYSGKSRVIKKIVLEDLIMFLDDNGTEFYRVEKVKLK